MKEKRNKKTIDKKRSLIRSKRFIAVVSVILAVLVFSLVFCVAVYFRVSAVTDEDVYALDEELPDKEYNCIIILGCGVKKDGRPSDMLKDRLDTGYALYQSGAAAKIIVSGDHGTVEYDEVNTMKDYLIEKGVTADDVFMDHAGFSTYDSIYRADYIFGVEKAIIVSQEFHLPRALYIASERGIDAVGVSADRHTYRGVWLNYLREVPARIKDYLCCSFSTKPKFLGETISLDGSGNVTNDKT